MDMVLLLLASYALTFWIQSKLLFLRIGNFLPKLLDCTFCIGFHTGWIIFLISQFSILFEKQEYFFGMIVVILFGLASASFCYFLDTFIRLMESHIDYGDE